jgi:hypothetical protein
MSDLERVKLEIEAKKKSGWIAALLNLFLPGAGYIYCGRVVLGILVMLICAIVAWGMIGGFGVAWGILSPSIGSGFVFVMVIDGFLCASRYNKKLIKQALAQHDSNRSMTTTKNNDKSSQENNITEHLEKLAALRDKGVLTEEEFQAQKTKLLSS